MSILVAGGAGYIGSHVCKLLEQKGFNIVVVDNLSHGYEDFIRWGKFVKGDIADRELLKGIFAAEKIEAVMHFCAFIEVGESVKDPAKYYANNVANTLSLLESMRSAGVNRFIFSSTAAVYGMPDTTPISEDLPKSPINPYGRSKWMVEQVLEDFDSAYGLKSIRFRYFNAAGADFDGEIGEAHVPETHLIPLVLDAVAGRRENITIFGTDYPTADGTCIRDYIHVNDLAEAHVLGLEQLLQGGDSDFFNLGCGQGYSVREVIDTVSKVTGHPVPVVEGQRRAGDPAVLVASSDKARHKLKWKPRYGLEEMVSTAWQWHQKLNISELK